MATYVAENSDLVIGILLRLPVKPLMRFKCVSKQWLSLISNPRFCRSHVILQYKNPHPFPSALWLDPTTLENCPHYPIIPLKNFDGDQSTRTDFNFNFLNLPEMMVRIMESCNGLLLVRARNYYSVKYFVCNPTTKQFVPLTFPTLRHKCKTNQLYLVFNPLKSSHYKVIMVQFMALDRRNREVHIVNVYSSETASWRSLEVCLPLETRFFLHGIYCNSAIHWQTDTNDSFYFDVKDECFKTYPMPLNFDMRNVKYFGQSGGHLHMVLRSFHSPTQFGLDIFVLKDDYSGWSLRFHVPLNHMQAAFTDLNSDFENMVQSIHIISIVRQEKEEDSMIVFVMGGRVIFYNLVNCTFREVNCFEPFSKSLDSSRFFQYFENLSWVGASIAYQHESYDL